MKKIILLSISIISMLTLSMMVNAQTVTRTVFSQNFETAAFSENIEGIKFLSWNPAVWIKSYDTVTPISGINSLKLAMTAIADDGNYQVRIDNGSLVAAAPITIDFKAGFQYRMTYKIRAAAATTIKHQFHKSGNPSDIIQNVALVGGNVVETKVFTSPVIVEAGVGTDFAWLWLMRDPSVATTVTIDDIVIEEINPAVSNTVYSADFETSTATDVTNNNIAGITYAQWAPSAWTQSIETASPITGSKSLKVNVTNTSNGDWSLQMYLNKTSVVASPINFQTGFQYKITYKVKSTNATTIKHIFSRDNTGETSEYVTLVGGNVVETKTFTTPTIVAAPAEAGFKWEWWFGAPSVATIVVFDDIVIEKVPLPVSNTVFSSDFEASTATDVANNNIGGITYSQWAPSAWTQSIETASPITGSKSLKVDVTNTSNGDWSLQMYLNNSSVAAAPINFQSGFQYKMTYKIKSSNATTIKHSFFMSPTGTNTENVTLVGGNVVETKTFTTRMLGATDDLASFKWEWWFGAPGVATMVVFDDIIIEKVIPITTNLKNVESFNLIAFSSAKQLNIKSSVNSKIEVYNLIGKSIAQRNVVANELVTLNVDMKSTFVLVKATDTEGNITVRKVIVR